MSKKNNRIAQQQIQDSKVKKNAKIISVLFWLGSSFYLYSTDIGFSDVYSWKPFIFFIDWILILKERLSLKVNLLEASNVSSLQEQIKKSIKKNLSNFIKQICKF